MMSATLQCHIAVIILLTLNFSSAFAHYNVPQVTIDVFSPKGFQVSIPEKEGVVLFGFYGKLNEKIDNDREALTWKKDIIMPKNGRYLFRDENTALKIGDVLYYSTYVIHDGIDYRSDEAEFIVQAYVNDTTYPVHSRTRRAGPTDCVQSSSIVKGVLQECANRLIFEEQFHGRTLNTENWSYERRFSGEPDYEFVTYMEDANVLEVKGGNLVIKPKQYVYVGGNKKSMNLGVNCTGEIGTPDCVRDENYFDILPPIISAQITTKGKFNFQYGNVMIRAKVPSLNWLFPQMFFEPSNSTYGKTDYSSGQMRIAFTQGGSTCNLYGGLVLSAKQQFRNAKMCTRPCKGKNDWSSDFHYYGLKWTKHVVILTVDDEKYCEVRPGTSFGNIEVDGVKIPSAELLKAAKDKMAPFDQPFHITLGVGVGGHGDFPETSPMKKWKNLDAKAMYDFWEDISNKPDYPNDELLVDFIHIFSI